MSDYTYTNGDGLTKLDATTPVGASEPISVLDDAIRQIKAYLKDPTSGVAALATQVANLATAVGSYGSRNFFSAYSNTNQTISTPSTPTKITFGLETADPNNLFDASNSKYTAPATGWFRFNLSMRVDWVGASTPAGIGLNIVLKKNGTNDIAEQEFDLDTNTGGATYNLARIVALNAGDYVEAFAHYTIVSGSVQLQITSDVKKTCFQGIREI